MFDAVKLTNDLKVANQCATDSVKSMNDGGTANLDAVFLRIPRINEQKIIKAIKDAGLYCRSKTQWIGSGYRIVPTCAGQGNTRSVGVEVMAKKLREFGYDVLSYCQND